MPTRGPLPGSVAFCRLLMNSNTKRRFLGKTYLLKQQATDEQYLKVERDQGLCQRCEDEAWKTQQMHFCSLFCEIGGDHKKLYSSNSLELESPKVLIVCWSEHGPFLLAKDEIKRKCGLFT
jgi:hypothetical protein